MFALVHTRSFSVFVMLRHLAVLHVTTEAPAAGRWIVTALVFMRQSGGARLNHWAPSRLRSYLQLENGFGVYDSTRGKDADCAIVDLLRPSVALGVGH